MINNVDVVLKVPCTKVTEVGTSIRKFTDKILGQSNKSKVLRLLNFSVLSFQEVFPLSTAHFLGFFKKS